MGKGQQSYETSLFIKHCSQLQKQFLLIYVWENSNVSRTCCVHPGSVIATTFFLLNVYVQPARKHGPLIL